jgi:chitin disaccharide deacetylase
MKTFTLFVAIFLSCFLAHSQTKNLAEKLGYPKDAKLLIIHADDAGFAHAADSAIISAYEKGVINSASIMVTCPWFPEIAAYAKKHPELDWGIHLSLTSERKNFKWGGVSSADEITSLLDQKGYLYSSNIEFAKNAKLSEAEKEIRAQINKALKFGIKLTHIDNHMGSIFASPDMLKMYQKVGKEYGLPVLIPMNMVKIMAPQLLPSIDANGVIVNQYIVAYASAPADKWKNFYNYSIQQLKSGLNELVFHLAFNGDEMKAIAAGLSDYGAEWRQQDYDYATSSEFKELLKKQGIYMVTWGMIRKVEYGK